MKTALLCHGFWKHQVAFGLPYWNPDGLPAVLKERGFEVVYPHVEWFGKLDGRAGQISAQVRDACKKAEEPVHLIAHSMGGLDVRRALALDTGLPGMVASVNTIATPHWGSVVADYVDEKRIDNIINRLFHIVGIPFTGLDDLTFKACSIRNSEMAAVEKEIAAKIPYRFFAGAQKADDIFWPLLFGWKLATKAPRAINVDTMTKEGKVTKQVRYYPSGPSDGMVSVDSAAFTDGGFGEAVGGVWNFDHLNFTGWWDPAEVDAFGRDDDPKHDSRWLGDFNEQYRAFAEEVVDGLE